MSERAVTNADPSTKRKPNPLSNEYNFILMVIDHFILIGATYTEFLSNTCYVLKILVKLHYVGGP